MRGNGTGHQICGPGSLLPPSRYHRKVSATPYLLRFGRREFSLSKGNFVNDAAVGLGCTATPGLANLLYSDAVIRK